MLRLYFLSTQGGAPGEVWSAGLGIPNAAAPSPTPAVAVVLPSVGREEAARHIRAIATVAADGQHTYQSPSVVVATAESVDAETLRARLTSLADRIEHDGLGFYQT